MRQILTSWNYKHLNPPEVTTLPTLVVVTPNMLHEGEPGGNMLQLGVMDQEGQNPDPKSKKQKWRMNEIETALM